MISIYCSEKLDGMAAAAIVLRHAILSKLDAHFGGFLHADSLHSELKDMASNEHQLIFVLDVPILPENLPLIERINRSNKIVYWNTHDSDSVVPQAKIFDSARDNLCSAELVQQRFLPNDLIAKKLASLAREVKFWQIKDPHSVKLADLIAAEYSPVELLDSLARGAIWNAQFEEFHKSYSERKKVALGELMRSLVVKSYVNHRFGFAMVSSILSSADACQRILDGHAGVDVAVVLYRDGRIGLRRRDDGEVNVKKIAELFNGGGRPFAAGARINMTVSKDNFEEVIFRLDEAFKNFFIGVTVS